MYRKKLKIIAGNCILESKKISLDTAQFLTELSGKYNFDLIYKSSYEKDNRSSDRFYSGLSLAESAKIFECLKKEAKVKILTDCHYLSDIVYVNHVADILQVPAYLCMQTKLVQALAKTNKPINIKKGQFLHPEDVAKIIRKIERVENKKIMVTERGTCFGYRDLVVDPRSFYILKRLGYPVFFDAGHSVRRYGIPSSSSKGGDKQFIPTLAKSAIATGIDGLFVEVHPHPKKAKCDAITQLSFIEFENLIKEIAPIWNAINMKGENN